MPRSPVTFGAPTAISHRPEPPNRPPEHYAGLVNPVGVLRTTSGGTTVAWEWAPLSQVWVHTAYVTIRTYFNDGTYEVQQGAVVMERGTWSAVA